MVAGLHDLHNQLTLIIDYAERLAWLVPQGPAREQSADLLRCAERAMAQTRDLLTAGPPQAPVRQPIDLNRLVMPSLYSVSRVMGDRVRVRLRLTEAPAPVAGDVRELERILLNLALNARDAMAGEGVLTVSTDVHADPDPHVRLTVTDTGTGAASDVRSRMFEARFTTKENATGLGMTLVAAAVSRLRGTIAVDTELRRGTSVTVTLPLAP